MSSGQKGGVNQQPLHPLSWTGALGQLEGGVRGEGGVQRRMHTAETIGLTAQGHPQPDPEPMWVGSSEAPQDSQYLPDTPGSATPGRDEL